MSNPTSPAVGTVLAAGQLADGSTAFKGLIVDTTGADAIGLVTAAPAALTLFGRLKAIADALATLITGVAATAGADDGYVVTTSDTIALPTVPKALYVSGSGTLVVKGAGGTTINFGTVAVGQYIEFRARYVMATGTSATVVALI